MRIFGKNKSLGFTLVELMVVVGISGLLVAGSTVLISNLQNESNRINLFTNANLMRIDLLSILQSQTAWDNTLADAANTSLACLNSGPCTTANIGTSKIILRDSGNRVVVDSTVATKGFTINGAACTTYDDVNGNNACPLRVDLTWQPLCTLPCAPNELNVTATFKYKPKNSNILFNGANFGFTIVKSLKPPCSAQTISNCVLGATASGGFSGACNVGYSGTCRYNCASATWAMATNACVPIVNGACGTANGASVWSVPSTPTQLCAAGTAVPATVTGSGSWGWNYLWNCMGSGGGTNASCGASQVANGGCGASNGTNRTAAPTATLCNPGTASVVTGTGPWSWTCAGNAGGSTANCSANLTVNGACGLANGTTVSVAPSGPGLCTAGTATAVAGTGPWTWSCNGVSGGTTAGCGANSSCVPSPPQTINNVYWNGTSFSVSILNGWGPSYPPYSSAFPSLIFAKGVPRTVTVTGPGGGVPYLYYTLACCAYAKLSVVYNGSTIITTIYGTSYGVGAGTWTADVSGIVTCP